MKVIPVFTKMCNWSSDVYQFEIDGRKLKEHTTLTINDKPTMTYVYPEEFAIETPSGVITTKIVRTV